MKSEILHWRTQTPQYVHHSLEKLDYVPWNSGKYCQGYDSSPSTCDPLARVQYLMVLRPTWVSLETAWGFGEEVCVAQLASEQCWLLGGSHG